MSRQPTTRTDQPITISWLVDSQATYRDPLFCELARRSSFRALVLFRRDPVRHYAFRPDAGYPAQALPAAGVPLPAPVQRRLDSRQAVLAPGATRRLLDETDVLVVPTWAQWASAWSMLRARRRGVPYVMYYESTLTSRRYDRGPVSWLRRHLLAHAGAVVVPGPAAREAALASGVAPERVVESVNSIDLQLFGERPRDLRRAAGAGRGSGAAEHAYLYVGQLIARKNVGALLDAFAGLDGAPTLDVAGDGVDLADLRDRAARLGVADRVRFHGFLDEDEVVELLARTQTLVLPSTEEVYGFTALEACVAGLHVVVSSRAGIVDNLRAVPGVEIVEPDVEGIRAGLEASRAAWSGWLEEIPADAASPERAAEDVLAAADLALRQDARPHP